MARTIKENYNEIKGKKILFIKSQLFGHLLIKYKLLFK